MVGWWGRGVQKAGRDRVEVSIHLRGKGLVLYVEEGEKRGKEGGEDTERGEGQERWGEERK